MKKNLSAVVSIFAIFLAFSTITFAQEDRGASTSVSKYVISAEAGGVNFVDGRVAVTRKVGRSGLLLKGDSVKVGDRVSTETESKAEILLNPGSYIRLGGNSSFEFASTSLEDLQIKLNRGSAMFEVITTNDFTFAVKTPKATFNIVKSGVYRVDVLEDGTGKIEVWKGKAQIGDDEDAEIKKGKTATVGGDDVALAKFDRDERDSLEEWSRNRAKELAKVNDRLERRTLRSTLISSFDMNRWNMFDSFGLWVYDPFWGGYCFLPFGYGWSSPYGFGFGRDIWYYRLPNYVYIQPPPRVNQPTGNGNSGNPPVREVRNPTVPTFQRIDQANGRRRITNDVDSSGGFPGRNPTPIIVLPQSPNSSSSETKGKRP